MQSAATLTCAVLALSAGCAPLAKVTEKRPELATTQASKAELSQSEQVIHAASKLRRTDPTRALGISFFLGGLRYHDQKYNPLAARTYSSMMLIAAISPGSLGSSIA